MDNLLLTVGRDNFSGWKEVRISESIERGAAGFTLKLTDRWAGQSVPRPVHIDEPCTLFIGNDLVLTGVIDDVEPDYDKDNYMITVRGRSRVADLIDCSGRRKIYRNENLLRIAQAECKPFGIDVVADVDVGAPFKSITRDAGEPFFDFLEQAARMRGLRLISNAAGSLLITRAGTARATTALVLGKNILRGRGYFSSRERFSEVTVMAQQAGAAFAAEASATPAFTEVNKRVTRYRPQVVLSQEPGNVADCKTRAQWQINHQQGLTQRATYTVEGWRQSPGGDLWAVNSRVPVACWQTDINGEMLIVQLERVLNEEGVLSEITVAPVAAYDILPLPEPKDDGGWGNV